MVNPKICIFFNLGIAETLDSASTNRDMSSNVDLKNNSLGNKRKTQNGEEPIPEPDKTRYRKIYKHCLKMKI